MVLPGLLDDGKGDTLPGRMTHLSRILVCGYYGFANTGDEAILAALARGDGAEG